MSVCQVDGGLSVGCCSLVFMLICLFAIHQRCDFCAFFNNDHFKQLELIDAYNVSNGLYDIGVEDYKQVVEEIIDAEPEAFPVIQDQGLNTYELWLQKLRSQQEPVEFMDGRMYVSGAKCDLDGNCTVVGAKKHNYFSLDKDVFRSTCFMGRKNGTKVQLKPSAKPLFAYGAHRHYKEKWVTFVAFLSFEEIATGGVVPEKILFDCDELNGNMMYPFITDELVAFENKTVLLLTQYYTHVDLSWIEIWLRHYLTIGVDLIVMYTSFDATSTAVAKNYSKALDRLIAREEFTNRIFRYNWRTLSQLTIHAYAQITMVNHGIQMFRKSVMLGADLDEILLPVGEQKITHIIEELTQTYGTWQVHWNSHKVKMDSRLRDSLKATIEQKNELSFHEMIHRSKRCDSSPTSPHSCKAKWMFYHPRPYLSGVHSASFFDPRPVFNMWKKGKWFNESKAIMLHLRGIQRPTE